MQVLYDRRQLVHQQPQPLLLRCYVLHDLRLHKQDIRREEKVSAAPESKPAIALKSQQCKESMSTAALVAALLLNTTMLSAGLPRTQVDSPRSMCKTTVHAAKSHGWPLQGCWASPGSRCSRGRCPAGGCPPRPSAATPRAAPPPSRAQPGTARSAPSARCSQACYSVAERRCSMSACLQAQATSETATPNPVWTPPRGAVACTKELHPAKSFNLSYRSNIASAGDSASSCQPTLMFHLQ